MRILILDVDNTLNQEDPKVILKTAKKLGYGAFSKEVWSLFENSAKDLDITPHPIPLANYRLLTQHYDKVIIITSRIHSWRSWTKSWLKKWGFHYDHLYLRSANDYKQNNSVVKEQIVLQHILNRYDNPTVVAIDDDKSVCEMYKSLGFKVFQAPSEWVKALDYHKRLNKKLYSSKNVNKGEKSCHT